MLNSFLDANRLSINKNIYFFKKESFYTKLKYSRVPQFDTSSGGIASLLSGFYGFLVSEKFGFELIDSGDFLFIIVYLILIFYILVLLSKLFDGGLFLTNFLINFIKSFF